MARGFGRWIRCKYCYRNVRPALGGIFQVVCSNCGAGLSPDFFVFENLKRYWKEGGSRELFEADRNSPEAKEWLTQKEIEHALKGMEGA